MQISGNTGNGAETGAAFAVGVDTSLVVQKIASPKEARALPCGTVVGDRHGGLTFTDAVAAALEGRSQSGWQERQTLVGETWTIIVLDR